MTLKKKTASLEKNNKGKRKKNDDGFLNDMSIGGVLSCIANNVIKKTDIVNVILLYLTTMPDPNQQNKVIV